MALRRNVHPLNLWGIDTDVSALKTAEGKGIIDKGYTDPQRPLRDSDLVIMCTYPGITTDFIRTNMDHFREGTIITDTAGIKSKLVREIDQSLRRDLHFVAGHPIAGREFKGIEFASETLFDDASYIITPITGNSEAGLAFVEDILIKLGVKNIIKMSPERHDDIISLISQLPHVIAVALANSGSGYETDILAGGSYRDATRVARINSQLWTELLLENSENVLRQIGNFEYNLARIKRAILEDKPETLNSIFDRARTSMAEGVGVYRVAGRGKTYENC